MRFFKYEPGKLGAIDARTRPLRRQLPRDGGVPGLCDRKYDKQIVRKLNKMMREGEYKKEAFQKLTGKTLEQLGTEWRATLGG